MLLTQTPYSASVDATSLVSVPPPAAYFVPHGYIFVSADVRGSGRSLDGTQGFFSARDAQDGVDLVKWAAKLAGSRGVVGLQGCSYLGQTQLYTAALLGKLYGARQPVKAMIPGCIGGDVYRDIYSDNGIPTPAWVGAGLAGGTLLGVSTEGYMVPKYADSQAGGDTAYDKAFWLQRDHVNDAASIVRAQIPALLWDGWQDNGFGGLELYAALQNASFGRDEQTARRRFEDGDADHVTDPEHNAGRRLLVRKRPRQPLGLMGVEDLHRGRIERRPDGEHWPDAARCQPHRPDDSVQRKQCCGPRTFGRRRCPPI